MAALLFGSGERNFAHESALLHKDHVRRSLTSVTFFFTFPPTGIWCCCRASALVHIILVMAAFTAFTLFSHNMVTVPVVDEKRCRWTSWPSWKHHGISCQTNCVSTTTLFWPFQKLNHFLSIANVASAAVLVKNISLKVSHNCQLETKISNTWRVMWCPAAQNNTIPAFINTVC